MAQTTFTMPENAVTVTANWEKNPEEPEESEPEESEPEESKPEESQPETPADPGTEIPKTEGNTNSGRGSSDEGSGGTVSNTDTTLATPSYTAGENGNWVVVDIQDSENPGQQGTKFVLTDGSFLQEPGSTRE